MSYNNLYIVDNSEENRSVKKYLSDWCKISKQMDIATGYFEIGGMLELNEEWKHLDKIRLLFGDEMTMRTKKVFDELLGGYLGKLDISIDDEKEVNEFLLGIPAVLNAIRSGKIECKVYTKGKFHAKTYITYFSDEYYGQFSPSMNIPKGYALVGSSNFTKAGLTKNAELNVQVSNDVEQLQDWFDGFWNEAEDITTEVLKVIEKHCKEYSPYEVYVRSMYEYFRGQEQTISEWEQNQSIMYPILSQYQKDGYYSLVNISEKYGGSFLCDGVGLGKTFVGMMLIERFVKKERKNVVLIVPASARVSVWEATINKYIPDIIEGFYSFKIINHTDLLRESCKNLMDKIMEQAECIIIDEAHHFRNRSSSRYRKLFDMIGNGCRKQMFMLTATPINNSFLDLQHLIELFSQRQEDYFKDAPLGIYSLVGHFRKMESQLSESLGQKEVDTQDASDETANIFRNDKLVNTLVVQRSRAYVKKSLTSLEGSKVLFPVRNAPTVAEYSLVKTYGKLIEHFVDSFYQKDKVTGKVRPILNLAVYSPYDGAYFIGDKSKIDLMKQGRQMQVVNLIRQLLLKRFESSAAAFEETCIRIFVRLLKFIKDYKNMGNQREIDKMLQRKDRIIEYVYRYYKTFETTIEDVEDELPEYIWEVEENLDLKDFDIKIMLEDTVSDIEVLAQFIDDLTGITPDSDDKIRKLINILKFDERINGKKVIIFSEYRSTAKYIYRQLLSAGFSDVYEIDGQTKIDKKDIVERFAPYYNDKSSKDVNDEINILVATDVLAEGLNLQDATCLINYELHWNPVRLMQRIGRVDRRRNSDIEDLLLAEHPELRNDRNNVYYWNFLPPKELEKLLSLYTTVSRKTLRISKTFGIEGKQLLTPEDDYEALKDFNSSYEGTESKDEEIALIYQKLMINNPEYETLVNTLPKKLYSGCFNENVKGIFFCFKLPVKLQDGTWSVTEGKCKWYLYKYDNDEVIENPYYIWKCIQCEIDEKRIVTVDEKDFSLYKKKILKYIDKEYMRKVMAPLGYKPRIIAWMQLV
jgi:ERCC4-related helicase